LLLFHVSDSTMGGSPLGQSQQFAQHIIDVSSSVICIYDVRQRKTVFVNRGFAAALGYAPPQEGLHEEFLRSVIHPDDWQPFLDHVGRLADLRDQETAEFEFRMRNSSGDWRWLHSCDKVFTRNGDGSVREIIGTATDTTQRRNAEEKIRF